MQAFDRIRSYWLMVPNQEIIQEEQREEMLPEFIKTKNTGHHQVIGAINPKTRACHS